MDRADESDLETESLVSVSVDAAQEEHAVPSTVPASGGVLRAAGHVDLIPMIDGSEDGSEHWIEAVPVGRLVLLSQGSHVFSIWTRERIVLDLFSNLEWGRTNGFFW